MITDLSISSPQIGHSAIQSPHSKIFKATITKVRLLNKRIAENSQKNQFYAVTPSSESPLGILGELTLKTPTAERMPNAAPNIVKYNPQAGT